MTQAELDALNDAIVANATAGVRSTRFGNRQVDKLTPEEQAAGAAAAAQVGVTDVRQLFGFHRTRLISAAKQ